MNTPETLSAEPVWVPYTLPKADMHVHVSLALSVESFLRRIKKTRTSLNAGFLLEREQRYYPTLQEFHAAYEAMRYITATPQETAEVVQNYLQRVAREGCLYAELSFSYRPGADFSTQMAAVTAGIEAAKHNTGIESRIVVTSLRDAGAAVAEQAVSAIKAVNNPFITGFGLVGNEAVTPLPEFKKALNMAWHEAGLGLVPHVAEQRIENALDFFDAMPNDALKNPCGSHSKDPRKVRIGHGTLTHRSTGLVQRFADSGICFEVCLSANKRIGIPPDMAHEHPNSQATNTKGDVKVALDQPLRGYFQHLPEHPLPFFQKMGIAVCLGSDNPLLMNTNIGKEYALARKYLGCSITDCLNFTRNALRFANLDAVTAQRLLQKVDDYAQRVALGKTPRSTALGYREAWV